MESRIGQAIRLKFEPVAVVFSDQKPPQAIEGRPGVRSCIIPMALSAARGKTSVFARNTTGCGGGTVGLGFGNAYTNFPGGFNYFLSIGRGEGYPEGEAYKKTPELVDNFVECLPITDIPYQYVVFKPLSQIDDSETPQVVIFYVNVDQVAALTVLANYDREGNENVIAPFCAGCHSICLIPAQEGRKEKPRAVIGLFDITVRPMIDPNMLSFAIPYKRFLEMEDNVAGSFLEKHQWHKVAERI